MIVLPVLAVKSAERMGSEPSNLRDLSVQDADVLLRAGIVAARSGLRERARDLLVRALGQDRQNVLAWLWLSGVLDQPEQQRDCLKKVLVLDPDNQAARRGLALLRQQEADGLVRAGIAAARAGQRERARDLLAHVLKQDQRNVLAWLWLSSVVDRPDEQRDCLKKVLVLDPDNQAARRGLALLQGRHRETTLAFARPTTSGEPQQLRTRSPGASLSRHRVSKRFVALGISAGAVLLVIGLLVIRPSLASRIGSQVPAFSSPQAETAAASSAITYPIVEDAATSTPTVSPGEAPLPRVNLAEPSQTEASTAAIATEDGLSTPASTPVVPPTATPLPTATPTPTVYTPTRIVIPSIGVDAPIVLATLQITDTGGILHQVWTVPQAPFAGWHEGSAALGTIGNTVINGHNWPQDAVFRDLHLIQPGEQITLYSYDTPFLYEVAEVLLLHEAGQPWEVRQSNALYIQATDDERVTIFTCYPYGSIQNRLIVIARPVESTPTAGQDE
jgi:sortase A